MKNYLKEVNILRSLSALSIILLHVTSGYISQHPVAYLGNQITRYASPIFVVLSGLLLYHLEKRKTQSRYPLFLKKRVSKVAIPYVIWTVIYTTFTSRHAISTWDNEWWFSYGKILLDNIFTGKAFVHLYFVLIMMQFYILFPLLRRWMESHFRLILWGSFAVTLASVSAIYLHQLVIFTLPSLKVPYVALFPLWLFYFVLGMSFTLYHERWKEYLSAKKMLMFLLWGISFFLTLYDGKVTGTYWLSTTPSSMLYAIMSFFFFYAVIVSVMPTQHKSYTVIDWIATHSYLIYLVHPLCLNVVYRACIKYGNTMWLSGIKGMFLLLVFTLIATFGSVFIINKLPFYTILGGNSRKKTKTLDTQKMDVA